MQSVPRVIPERRVAIPKDVLPSVSGTATGAPKLALPQVVIVPAPTSLPRPSVPEDPELLALRRDAQAARARGITIAEYRRSLTPQVQPHVVSQPRVGARPRTPPPPEPTATAKQRMLARKYNKTIQEVLDARRSARRLGMSTEDLLDQMAQAERDRPTTAVRERRQIEDEDRFVNVQQSLNKGKYHGWKDRFDQKFNGHF